MIGSGALTAVGAQDHDNDIGGSTAGSAGVVGTGTGNRIYDTQGIGTSASLFVGLTGNFPAIANLNQYNNNISNNDITSASATTNGGGALEGIRSGYSATTANPPAGVTITTTVNNNTLRLNNTPLSGGTGALNSIIVGGNLANNFLATLTISNNIIDSCSIAGAFVTGNTFRGVIVQGNWNAVNVVNNTLTRIQSNAISGQFQGIVNNGAAPIAICNFLDNKFGTATKFCFKPTFPLNAVVMFCVGNFGAAASPLLNLTITGNDFRGFIMDDTCKGAFIGISNQSNTNGNTTISDNTFTRLEMLGFPNGGMTLLNNSADHPAGSVQNINNNSIVDFMKITGYCSGGGDIQLYGSDGAAGPLVTETNSGNNFSNITFKSGPLQDVANFAGWDINLGPVTGGAIKNVFNNTFDNIVCDGGGDIFVLLYGVSSAGSHVTNNVVSNISTGGGSIGGIIGGTGSALITLAV